MLNAELTQESHDPLKLIYVIDINDYCDPVIYSEMSELFIIKRHSFFHEPLNGFRIFMIEHVFL